MEKRFKKSLRNSIQGFKYALRTERHMRIHAVVFLMVIVISFFVPVTLYERIALVLAGGMVIVAELVNTAIENLIDLKVERKYHPMAWIGKDVAAAAVLFSAAVAVIVGVAIGWQVLQRLGG